MSQIKILLIILVHLDYSQNNFLINVKMFIGIKIDKLDGGEEEFRVLILQIS